jgi:hypothetical protein
LQRSIVNFIRTQTTEAHDFEGRVTAISGNYTASYSYNGVNTRVSKTEGGVTNTFRRDGIGVTSPVLSDGSATYTPGVPKRRGSTTTYMHSGLKNAEAQTGTSKTVTAERTYDAFGNVVSSTGTWKGPFGYAGSHGYQEDGSGYKLLGHRLYDLQYEDRDMVGGASPFENTSWSTTIRRYPFKPRPLT